MEYYNPRETMNFDQTHTVHLKFQYENATAEVITKIGGNICGGSVLQNYTEFKDIGMTAPYDHPLNQKHCVFEDEEEQLYREVEYIRFYYPDGNYIDLDLEDADDYLVSVSIINYQP
jgi:hypothetical protein